MSEDDYRFDVDFLEDAFNSIASPDFKTQEKVLENIRISRFKTDTRILKYNMKTYKLKEVKDKLIGKIGTSKRDDYELRIKLLQLGQLIKEVRKEKKLTQGDLGDLIGVTKSHISKLENGTSNMTIGTIFKIFAAMKSEIQFEVISKSRA